MSRTSEAMEAEFSGAAPDDSGEIDTGEEALAPVESGGENATAVADQEARDSALADAETELGLQGQDVPASLKAVEEALGVPDAAGEKKPGAAGGTEEKSEREPEPTVSENPFEGDPPEGLSERGKARFEKMVASHRQLEETHQGVAQRLTGIADTLAETKASSEELATTFHFLKLYHSENPDHRRQALDLVRQQERELSLSLGEPSGHEDSSKLLEAHPDLRDAVENLEISEAHAKELATARNSRTHQETRQRETTTARERETTEVETYRADVVKGQQALDAFQAGVQKSDPDYNVKIGLLTEGRIQQIVQTTHPAQWVARVQELWDGFGAAAEAVRKKPTRDTQPIRGTGGTGAATRSPESALEAITAALGDSALPD